MRTLAGLLGFFGLMAGLAFGGGAPLQGGDDFNDNTRNTAAWKIMTGCSGALTETNGRLLYDSLGREVFSTAVWYWKTRYFQFYGDKLQASILVNCPRITLGSPSSYFDLGLGFANSSSATSKLFRARMVQWGASRQIMVDTAGGDLPDNFVNLPIPRDVTRFYLIIRYSTVTGKVTVWQQAVDGSWMEKICVRNLNVEWNVPLGTDLPLMPFVVGSSGNQRILPGDRLFIDNFSVSHIIP